MKQILMFPFIKVLVGDSQVSIPLPGTLNTPVHYHYFWNYHVEFEIVACSILIFLKIL